MRDRVTVANLLVPLSSGVATGGLGGRVPHLSQGRLRDSSRSDEKLVRLGGGYHSVCLDNFGILGRYITVSYLHTNYHSGLLRR